MPIKPILFIFFICSFSFGQKKKVNVDSLKQILKSTKIADSIKCQSYIALIRHYKKTDVDSCKSYFAKYASYAKTNNSDLAFYSYYKQKAGYYGLFLTAGEDAKEFINSNLLKSLDYSKKIDNPELNYIVYSRLSQENARLGYGEEALEYLGKAEAISKKHGLWKETAFTYGQYGKIYNLVFDKTELALTYLLKSDSIYESHNFQGYKRGFTLSFIGDVYQSFEDYDKAIEYQEQAFSIFEISDNEFQQKFILSKLATIENERENYDNAIAYAKDARLYYKTNKFPMQEAMLSVILGDIYYNNNQIVKALEEGEYAINLNRANNHEAGLMVALLRQSNKLRENKNYINSNQLALEAEGLALKMDGYEELVDIYEVLYLNSESLGNYKKAYHYSNEFNRVKDSLLTNKNLTKAKEIEAKYQTEKKEQEIALLKTEKDLIAQKQKSERNLLIGGLGITSVAGIFMFLLYRNRRKTNMKLRELDELKSNFFTNISHEFRTPLTIISGIAQKRNHDNHDIINEENKILSRNSDRLIYLVNQLLDISKIESNEFKIHVSKSDLSGFLKGLASSFNYSASKNDYNYEVTIQEMPSEWYDKDVIEKIVTNLLSNAFKYSDKNGIIEFKAKKEQDSLVLSIRNDVQTDYKIDEHKIFDRFFQIDDTQEGTGIGLALVKELVTLYQGDIEVRKINNAVQFDVTLTLKPDKFEIKDIVHEATISDNLSAQNIKSFNGSDVAIIKDKSKIQDKELPVLLIVEDNEDMGSFLINSFNQNYNVIYKKDGLEGWESAIKEIPDLIISDVMMPNMDGFTLCQKLKTDERTSHIPVILLTAKAEDKDKYIGLETGADDYVTKPFNLNHLQKRVENLLHNRSILQTRYQQEIILKPTDVQITSYEENLINKIQDIIDANIRNSSFTIEDFAIEISMSRMQLHRKLKALTGLSASEFLRSQRLKLAIDLLQNNTIPISQVGYEVGFSNPSYFSKCFKETYDCTPTDFRNKFQ